MNLFQLSIVLLCAAFAAASGPASCSCGECANMNCNVAAKACDSFDGGVSCSGSKATCDNFNSWCTPQANYQCMGYCAAFNCTDNVWACAGNKMGSCACEECPPLACADAQQMCALYSGEAQCTESATSASCVNVDTDCGSDYDGGNAEADCSSACSMLNCKVSKFTCNA